MVAYNFKSSFAAPIRAGIKRQTIRLPRARHARPGERLQLFVGMRTDHCEKIIPDPVCVGVDEVSLRLSWLDDIALSDAATAGVLLVNGIPLTGADADIYARGDGFAGVAAASPFEHMCRWWVTTHGRSNFHGVAIRWERTE